MEGAMVDEFEAAQASLKRPGVAGWWVKVLEELDDERRESLMRAKANPHISHRAISVVLQGWGFEVSREQVAHWRRNVR